MTAVALLLHFHGAWRVFLLLISAAPLIYYALATYCAWRFFSRERARKFPTYTPAVSVLKPVRGVDFASYENFASFCQQDYPEYEILFAVNDAADPAVPLIHQLMAQFPERRIRLFIGANQIGSNRKVNKLARLAEEAQHEILALTDGDVRVGCSYLREVVAPLADERAGAVTSFYRAVAESNLGAELEAVGAAGDFFAGVLVAERTEGISFALGASIVTTKGWLGRIGGFASIADTHSDDYELGHRIAQAGGKMLLSRTSVWTMYPAQNFRGLWNHQVRWARTVRQCRPFSYAGLLFTQGLPWALLAAAIAPAAWISAAFLAGYLVLRFVMAWTVGVWGIGDDVLRRKMWLLPLRDALHFAVWVASFASNRIVWGDAEFMMNESRMTRVDSSSADGKPAEQVPR